MKTIITLAVILSSSIFTSLFSQAFSTNEYLKATNKLWNICSDFRIIKDSEHPERERDATLFLIKNNLESIRNDEKILISKYPNDEDTKKLDLWIKTIDKAYENLKSNRWETEPIWQMGFTLIEMDLKDFVNKKLIPN